MAATDSGQAANAITFAGVKHKLQSRKLLQATLQRHDRDGFRKTLLSMYTSIELCPTAGEFYVYLR